MINDSNKTKTVWELNFDDLVQELAYNYYACSFGDSKLESSEEKELISKFINDREDRIFGNTENGAKIKRTRNIIIIGAGCSMDSYSGIPGGELLIKRFKEENENNFIDKILKRYEHDKKEIKSITGKDNLSFENYLYIMSRAYMTQSEMRSLIDDYTNFRYSPVYFDEIVAHMLKHSFVDAVINFNFEETLDQSISEEIGEGNYHNIISDGHCIDLDSITTNGTMKVPIYIKPHGTNSHKSTLRFTNKHYFDIPDDICRMMKCLIGGFENSLEIDELLNIHKKDSRIEVENFGESINKFGRKRRTIDKVNLICVGFNMESIEFLDILNSYLPTNSDIYYINYKEPNKELYREVYHRRLADFFISKDSKEWEKWKKREDWERDTTKLENQECVKNIFDEQIGKRQGFKFIQCSDDYTVKNDNTGEEIKMNNLNLYENKRHFEGSKFERIDQSSWKNSLPPLGRLFNYIYSDIYTNFEKPYLPQHIHRHKLISLLFHDTFLRQPYDNSDPSQNGISDLKFHITKQAELRDKFEMSYNYFLDRTIVEIAIAFLRGHGAIDYFELKHGRVRTYYKLYRRHVEKHNLKHPSKSVNTISLARLVLTFTDIEDKDQITLNIIKISLISDVKIFNELDSAYGTSFIKHKSDGLVKVVDDFVNSKEKRSVFFRKYVEKPHIKYKRNLTATVIYKLLSHAFISLEFKERLKASMRLKGIQRIKNDESIEPKELTYIYKPMTHLQMIIHSANYLVGNNFYSISMNNPNSDLITWQSFNLNNQLHTNLKLDFELNRKLEKEQNRYNLVLSVSEVGNNILHNLRHSKNCILNKADMHVVQICSFEAIKQLHSMKKKVEITEADYVKRLINDHKKYMLNVEDNDPKLDRLILLFIPFTLHNHHMTLFSEIRNNNEEDINHDSAIYIWRRGFSTQMTPILINKIPNCSTETDDQYNTWVKNDLGSLYNIFIKYLDRGMLFNVLHSIESGKNVNDSAMDTNARIQENLDKIEKASGISFQLKGDDNKLNYLQFLDTFDETNLADVRKKFYKYIEGRKLGAL